VSLPEYSLLAEGINKLEVSRAEAREEFEIGQSHLKSEIRNLKWTPEPRAVLIAASKNDQV